MALGLKNWNIAENIVWFVRLSDSGTGVSVEMYLTQADAESRTNLQAAGEGGYGTDVEIALTKEPGASVPVSPFQGEYSWHLVVSGESGDGTKILKVREFVEMDEISHPIYRNAALIASRAAAEINAHTHAAIIRNIGLGTHLPEMEPGRVLRVNSARHGVNDLSQVREHRILGTPDTLVSELEAWKYMELKR